MLGFKVRAGRGRAATGVFLLHRDGTVNRRKVGPWPVIPSGEHLVGIDGENLLAEEAWLRSRGVVAYRPITLTSTGEPIAYHVLFAPGVQRRGRFRRVFLAAHDPGVGPARYPHGVPGRVIISRYVSLAGVGPHVAGR